MLRSRILLIGLLAGSSLPALAQTAVLPVYACTLPGTQATVSGLKSTNYQQGIIPSCLVTVYLTGTQTLATTTPQSPFTANTNGSIPPIYAAINQGYDVVLSGGVAPNTYPAPVTLTGVMPSATAMCATPLGIPCGGTGATTAAGAALNIIGATITGALGTSSQVTDFPGTLVTSNALQAVTSAGVDSGVYFPSICGVSQTGFTIPSWCAGSDLGAWTNAALAAGAKAIYWAGGATISTPVLISHPINLGIDASMYTASSTLGSNPMITIIASSTVEMVPGQTNSSGNGCGVGGTILKAGSGFTDFLIRVTSTFPGGFWNVTGTKISGGCIDGNSHTANGISWKGGIFFSSAGNVGLAGTNIGIDIDEAGQEVEGWSLDAHCEDAMTCLNIHDSTSAQSSAGNFHIYSLNISMLTAGAVGINVDAYSTPYAGVIDQLKIWFACEYPSTSGCLAASNQTGIKSRSNWWGTVIAHADFESFPCTSGESPAQCGGTAGMDFTGGNSYPVVLGMSYNGYPVYNFSAIPVAQRLVVDRTGGAIQGNQVISETILNAINCTHPSLTWQGQPGTGFDIANGNNELSVCVNGANPGYMDAVTGWNGPVAPGNVLATALTYTPGATSISVAGCGNLCFMPLANTGATTIENITGGTRNGQILAVVYADANTTFGSTGNIFPGQAVAAGTNKAHEFVYHIPNWYEISPGGYTGSCPSTTTLTVVAGIITGCS